MYVCVCVCVWMCIRLSGCTSAGMLCKCAAACVSVHMVKWMGFRAYMCGAYVRSVYIIASACMHALLPVDIFPCACACACVRACVRACMRVHVYLSLYVLR